MAYNNYGEKEGSYIVCTGDQVKRMQVTGTLKVDGKCSTRV